MRIIAGQARGTPLKIPKGDARPTADRVREALFSILGPRIDGARVLDLFAGSGSLGLEALSRGASEAVFVEQSRAACVVIDENLRKSRLSNGRAHCAEVLRYLRGGRGRFDIVFADPPYKKQAGDHDFAAELLACESLREIIEHGGLLVLETAGGGAKNDAPLWEVLDSRTYGDTAVTLYQPAEKPSAEVPA